MSKQLISDFENGTDINSLADVKQGMIPGNVDAFVRLWFEVNRFRIGFHHSNYTDIVRLGFKWFPYNKGGSFRRWYGNIEHIINMENNGYDIKYSGKNNNYRLREPELYFKEAISWSKISSGAFSMRYMPSGCLFDIAGCCAFSLGDNLNYILGFTNTCINSKIMNLISPTLNYEVEHIKRIPIIFAEKYRYDINDIVEDNISASKTDWDSFETSWDFAEHPLVKWSRQLRDATSIGATMAYYYHGERPEVSCPVELCYMLWQGECNDRFAKLKANEEELNRIFIDIYGLQDELTPEVEDKDVTVRRADLGRDIRSLISYAVGCIFGRYSLDKPGLAYAGGDWNPDQYHTFTPDADNVIPITDEEYFTDDLTGLFVAWVKKVFGAGSLEDNLAFIAKALGTKGTSPRAVIRNYFLNGFYADHVKIYQKRPIYWLYDSGKQNGFKALIYMHRYNADTSGLVRADYLYKMEQVYESEIARMDDAIAHGASREVAQATKRKEKLVKQLKECKDYDDRLGHIALARIPIDLDDGVKVNYEKVQTGADGKKQAILAKI